MEILGIASVPTWLLLLVVVLLAYYIYMTWNNNVFKSMGVPMPEGSPILGHLPKYQKEGQFAADVEWMQKHGKVFGTIEGGVPILVVADTDMLRQILVKDFNNFTDRRVIDGLNGELERGLTALKGEHWKHVRNLMTPTFSAGKLKRMMPLILNASEKLVENTRRNVKESKVQDLKRVFGGYSMDVIASTAFGIEVDSQSNKDDPFVKYAAAMFKFSLSNLVGIAFMFFPFILPIIARMGFSFFPRSSQIFFRDLVIKIMNERKENIREYKDFLQLMLEARRSDDQDNIIWDSSVKGLSTQEIISQAILFFVAGYETTGTTLSLLAYNLALNPEKQQKLYEEVMDKLGTQEPSYENVHDLVYLEMCINETLRLFPPATRFDRKCVRDTEVKGVKIPKDMFLSVPVYGIHHSPEIWKDPEEFIPERFAPEEKANMNPLHFLPFGYGPRNCIGMRLAYLEAKVAIADFIRNFSVSVCEKTQIPPNFQKFGILIPDNVLLSVEERKKLH